MRRVLLATMLILLTTMIILAHGNDEDDPDDHDVVDTSGAIIPENPTYYEHIKPLLELHCLACHTEGQISGDIPLTDPETVEKGSSDIAFNTSIGYMPPWMPSGLSLPLKHNRSLSDTEIATFVAWSDKGAPLGEPDSYTPPTARHYQLADIRADITLQLDEPYTPDEIAQDDYRCFAFPLDIDSTNYVTGYEFIPDVTEMAHHGIVYLVDEGARGMIASRDGSDGRAGWSCYGGIGLSTSTEMLGTWAPGTLPEFFPVGTGYRIEAGDYLVVQMHYNLAITRQPDQTQITLQLADAGETIAELTTLQLLAPVEIPCPIGVSGEQCDRDTSLERVGNLYGEHSRHFPNSLLRDCNQTLDDYVENIGEDARTFCDFRVPAPLTVYGLLGHMHELGRSFQLELNPDSDNRLILLDIPLWDFHWQDRYQLVDPLQLERGDTVRMTCNWDNTLSADPRYVVWGEGTSDEMCFGTLMVLKP